VIDHHVGSMTISSPWFSRIWRFTGKDGPVAHATRNVAHRTSRIALTTGEEWILMPDGWGRIRLLEGDRVLATGERQDFLGRHWELHSDRFSYQLESESMVKRHWTIGPVGSPFATLRGGFLSFNTMTLESGLPIPLEAVVLAWQAIVRPWEAAATGIGPSR
jgi:hypothetical protein